MQEGAGGKAVKLMNNENIKVYEECKVKTGKVSEIVSQCCSQRQTNPKPQQRQRRPLGDIYNVITQQASSTSIVTGNTSKERYLPLKKRHYDQVIKSNEREQISFSETNTQKIKANQNKNDLQNQKENHTKIIDQNKYEGELDEITQSESLFFFKEYVDEVYVYLRKLESVYDISPNHLDKLEITGKMRTVLVDWMIEAISHFGLCQETLQLSVFLLDKYSELRKTINKRNAQLIAVVSMFVAAKFEEIEPLDVYDLIIISDSAVKKKDILQLEKLMISTLEFNLSKPLPVHFVRRYSLTAQLSPIEECYAMYFCDAAQLEYTVCSVRSSILAAAAVFLALCVSKDNVATNIWTDKLIKVSTYHLKDFYHILPRIALGLKACNLRKFDAVKRKYSTDNQYQVSLMPGVHPLTKGGVIEYFCQ